MGGKNSWTEPPTFTSAKYWLITVLMSSSSLTWWVFVIIPHSYKYARPDDYLSGQKLINCLFLASRGWAWSGMHLRIHLKGRGRPPPGIGFLLEDPSQSWTQWRPLRCHTALHCPSPRSFLFIICRQWIRLHFCNKKGRDCGTIFCKAAGRKTQKHLQGADCGISFDLQEKQGKHSSSKPPKLIMT